MTLTDGDRVLLWQRGEGNGAGLVAGGVVSGTGEVRRPAQPARHEPRLENRQRPVPSSRIEFTHWFHAWDRVTPEVLSQDRELRKLPGMFGSTSGPKAIEVSLSQYKAVMRHVPPWADLMKPTMVEYAVELAAPTRRPTVDGAAADLRNLLATGDGASLLLDVRRPDGESRGAVDLYGSGDLPTSDTTLVVWSAEWRARTAFEALSAVVSELSKDPSKLENHDCSLELVGERYSDDYTPS